MKIYLPTFGKKIYPYLSLTKQLDKSLRHLVLIVKDVAAMWV